MQKFFVVVFAVLSSFAFAPGGSPRGGGGAENFVGAGIGHAPAPVAPLAINTNIQNVPRTPPKVPGGTPGVSEIVPDAPGAPRIPAGRAFFGIVDPADPVIRALFT